MNTYIERKLKQIRKTSQDKNFGLSCDIYYNDLADEYVVRCHDHRGVDKHFRSNHIRKSLKMALKWLKNLK